MPVSSKRKPAATEEFEDSHSGERDEEVKCVNTTTHHAEAVWWGYVLQSVELEYHIKHSLRAFGFTVGNECNIHTLSRGYKFQSQQDLDVVSWMLAPMVKKMCDTYEGDTYELYVDLENLTLWVPLVMLWPISKYLLRLEQEPHFEGE